MNEYQITTKLEDVVFKVLNKLKGFKTIIFTIVVGSFSIMEALDWTNTVSKENLPYVIGGIGIINLVLRSVSNTKIGKNT